MLDGRRHRPVQVISTASTYNERIRSTPSTGDAESFGESSPYHLRTYGTGTGKYCKPIFCRLRCPFPSILQRAQTPDPQSKPRQSLTDRVKGTFKLKTPRQSRESSAARGNPRIVDRIKGFFTLKSRESSADSRKVIDSVRADQVCSVHFFLFKSMRMTQPDTGCRRNF